MSIIKKITKNFTWLVIASILTSILLFILNVFIARNFGPENFGIYALAMAIASFFALLADPGLSPYSVRKIARKKSSVEYYAGNLVTLRILLFFVAFSLFVLTINVIEPILTIKLAMYLFGGYFLLKSLAITFDSFFRSFEIMEYESITKTVSSVFIFLSCMTLIYLGYSFKIIALFFFFGSLLNITLGFFITNRKITRLKFRFDFKFWKKSIKTAFPFVLAGIFGAIYYRLDIILLSLIKDNTVVGWYNAAYQIVKAFIFIPALFTASIFPTVSRLFKNSKGSLKKMYIYSFKYIIYLVLPLTVGMFLLAREVLVVYGNAFTDSVLALKILAWTLPFLFLNYLFGCILNATNKERIFAYIIGSAAGLNLILNLFLIPKFSYVGAGIATIIAVALISLFSYIYLSKSFYKIQINKLIWKPLAACFIMGVFIYCLGFLNIFLLVLIGAIIYFISLYLLKGFQKEDKLFLKEIIKR